jgi:hypothetical protein
LLNKQIAEPPGAAAIGEAATDKPDFVAAAHFGGGVDGVELSVVQEFSVRQGSCALFSACCDRLTDNSK